MRQISPTPLRMRIPLIPGVTDTDHNLDPIIRFAVSLTSVQGIDLLPFHRIGRDKYRRLGMHDPMAKTAPLPLDQVAAIKQRFESAGFAVSIGG